MAFEAQSFIDSVTEEARRLEIAYNRAQWEAATEGSDKANEREKEAQAELLRFWSDPDRFQKAKELHEAGADDPLTGRLLRVIYLAAAKAQQDEATIEKLTELEAKVRKSYYNFRASIDGREVSDNELDRILRESQNTEEVRSAWEASKQIGAQVADTIRELARTRNAAAQAQGYRDHFQRSLTLDEIDEDELLGIFADLEEQSNAPYADLKSQIDEDRAERFGESVADLGPWHFADRFFQRAPSIGSVDLDEPFKGQDPVEIALRTYDGWGLEVRDILERSDLYPRPGKNQHAFCTDIDREGDIRTLNNLEANRRWTGTLLHELGHAVYFKYIDSSLPWLLREPPHILSTEAIALLTESVVTDPSWLAEMLDLSGENARQLGQASKERQRAEALIFTRWVLVMTNFERALYADPDQDLDSLWWELKERFQKLHKPAGRSAPDWAAKYHVALAPVYYHNYELGHLFRAQLQQRLDEEVNGLVREAEVGQWLRENVFSPGAEEAWSDQVVSATGEPLSAAPFVAGLTEDSS